MATHSTTALQLDNPFWHFALQFWQQPDIEACCLALQDEGLSINRLLFCLWLADNGLQLPAGYQQADHWQQQISHPVRALRFSVRPMKTDDPALEHVYQALRKAELACEQVEIAHLWQASRHSPSAPAGLTLAQQNLKQWLQQQQRPELYNHPALQTLINSWQIFT